MTNMKYFTVTPPSVQ